MSINLRILTVSTILVPEISISWLDHLITVVGMIRSLQSYFYFTFLLNYLDSG